MGAEKAIAISHSPVTAVAGGEFLCLPYAPGIDVRKIEGIPEKVGTFFCYAPRFYYRLDECPQKVKDYMTRLRAYRWSPAGKVWKPEIIKYGSSEKFCNIKLGYQLSAISR